MSNVLIEKHTIDNLANAISVKSGESVPMTLTEMIQAVDGIDTSGGGGITPTGNIDITQSGVTDVTQYATATVPNTTAAVQSHYEYYTDSGVKKWRVKAQAVIEPGDSYDPGWIGATIEEPYHNFNAVAKNTTITPSTSSQTIGGANYMMEGAVTVSAMPLGSATPASSISATGASVTTGTNTLTLSKSSVANTPQVSAGYISSGTQGNSSVSLSASVTTKGATTYYPGTSDQTISASQYLTGTQTIKAVSQTNLEAGNIKSGTTVTISNGNGNIWSVTGSYTGGGASNIVQGTFTTGSSTGTTATVSIPYTGSGYPIACFVYIDGGAYNNTATGNTTWYNSVQRYAVGVWSMTKSVMTSTPTYGTSGSQNYGVTEWIYKNSTSQATTYSRSSAMTTNVYTSSDATGAGATCVRFKANSGKTLSYYVASTSYGLLASTKYAYIVVYSS